MKKSEMKNHKGNPEKKKPQARENKERPGKLRNRREKR